jgi:hypothetical protein
MLHNIEGEGEGVLIITMDEAVVLLPLLLVRRDIFFDGMQTSEHGLYYCGEILRH